MDRSNALDGLDDYLERRGGVDDSISNEAEELLVTATSCPKCGSALSTNLLCKDCCPDCGAYRGDNEDVKSARRKLDEMGISYE